MKHLLKFLEVKEEDFEPLNSFHMKDELNSKVWDSETEMKKDIRKKLIEIATDFYESTELEVEVKDITLTGSLANYNWSDRYSDYDLHILIDYSDVNDDVDLVRKYVGSLKSMWNEKYDIHIEGYEVEIYIQDINEPHISTGIYSLNKDEWIVAPEKRNFTPDKEEIRKKAEPVMLMIKDLEMEEYMNYDTFKEQSQKVWDKIKKYRRSGLDSEGGELSTGNLVFKLLRRNGYITKLLDLKTKAYEKKFK